MSMFHTEKLSRNTLIIIITFTLNKIFQRYKAFCVSQECKPVQPLKSHIHYHHLGE